MRIKIITKQGEVITTKPASKIEFNNTNKENSWNSIEITYLTNPSIKRAIYPIEKIKEIEIIEEQKK